ncbi:MAG: glycosyltransferase [Patescibacteria group bacterium]
MFISEHASPLASIGGSDSGGQNIYVDKVSTELAKRGFLVDVFTRKDDKDLPEVVDCHNGVRVIQVTAGKQCFVPKEEMLPLMGEFEAEIEKFVARGKLMYDLIHAHFFMSGLVAINLKRKLQTKVVITFHALGKVRKIYQGDSDKFPEERLKIEERIVGEADAIVAECPQDKEDLINLYQANKKKISIIPCGFDPNELKPIDKVFARKLLGLNVDDNIILQLGRLVPRKGIANVIKAVGILHKEEKISARLLVVGGESETANPEITPEIGRLQKIAKESGVFDKVAFLGKKGRHVIKNYYSAADVFVSTPWYEPFGITPLESMACGTPVIGSRVGGIKYSVAEGETGLLVEPEKPRELAYALKDILSNKTMATKMAIRSIYRVNKYFKWSDVAKMMENLYEEVLQPDKDKALSKGNYSKVVEANFQRLREDLLKTKSEISQSIVSTTKLLVGVLQNKKKVFVAGNGGSAMDAQHWAAEMVGHYMLDDRKPLAVLSLTSDTAIITALANDFSFDEIFSKQVEALGDEGDALVLISTSGNSKNLLNAAKAAKKQKMLVVGLLGKEGGKLKERCDISIVIPSDSAQSIQEIHINIIHTICELTEKELIGKAEISKKQKEYLKRQLTSPDKEVYYGNFEK